jgi:uncharacterized protein (DUF2236 family)
MKLREDIKNIATRYGMREITWEVAENEFVDLFQKYADEVIGEDETGDQIKDLPQVQSFIAGIRNRLRSEQRERINKIS